MSYIKTEDVVIKKLTCSHPKIDKFWEYGALAAIPTSGVAKRIISMLWYDGDKECRRDFKDDGNGDEIINAERFLQTLN